LVVPLHVLLNLQLSIILREFRYVYHKENYTKKFTMETVKPHLSRT